MPSFSCTTPRTWPSLVCPVALVLVEQRKQRGAGLDVVAAAPDDLSDLRSNDGLEDSLLKLHEWMWTAHATISFGHRIIAVPLHEVLAGARTSGHTTGSVSMKTAGTGSELPMPLNRITHLEVVRIGLRGSHMNGRTRGAYCTAPAASRRANASRR
jgi:hypothetical protein